VLLCFKKNSAI